MTARTLFAKIWDAHVVADLGDNAYLLHIDRHLLHDLGGSRGLLDLKGRGIKVHSPHLTFATPDHAISSAKRPRRHLQDRRRAAPGPARRDPRGRHPHVRHRRARAGHRARDGAGAGLEPARLPDRVRRQPHLHARRHGRAGLRHRLERAGACAGDADAGAAAPPDLARQLRWRDGDRRDAQGPDPAADRRDRRRRRHRLCGRVRRQRHPRAARRGPAHHLQPVDRARRQDGLHRPRRDHLRLSRGPAVRAQGGHVGAGGGGLAAVAERRRRQVRPRGERSTSLPSPRRSPGAPAPST